MRNHSLERKLCVWPLLYPVILLLLPLSEACKSRTPDPTSYVGFVASGAGQSLAALDFGAFRVVRRTSLPFEPAELVVRPSSHELWIVNSDASRVRVMRFPDLGHSEEVLHSPERQARQTAGRKRERQARSVAERRSLYSRKKLAFTPDARFAVLLTSGDQQLVFIDCTEHREIWRLPLDSHSTSVRSHAWTIRPEPGSNDAITHDLARRPDTIQGRSTESSAHAEVAVTPDGKTVVVSSPDEHKVYFVNVASRTLTGSVTVDERPSAIAVLPDSSKIFVADTAEKKVSAIDIRTRQVLSRLEIGVRAGPMLVKPDGGELFILSPDSTLVIIDAFHDNVEQDFPLGRTPVAATFRPDAGILYVADAGDGSIMAIDVQNRRALSSTHTGGSSRSLALTPDSRFLAVADADTSSVAVLRTALMDAAGASSKQTLASALLTTIPVGVDPVSVVITGWVWNQAQ